MKALLLAALLAFGLVSPAPAQEIAAPPAKACGDLLAFAEKWQAVLFLRDWKIVIGCAEIPESEQAWALSWIDPYQRTIVTVIDPDAQDQEGTVLHELMHAPLVLSKEADSELIDEQIVITLTELIRRLEKPNG